MVSTLLVAPITGGRTKVEWIRSKLLMACLALKCTSKHQTGKSTNRLGIAQYARAVDFDFNQRPMQLKKNESLTSKLRVTASTTFLVSHK